MCRILARRHSCHHITKHRLSRCAATFTKPGRRGRVLAASCSSEAYISLCSSLPCGPCQYADFDRAWTDRIDKARERHKKAVLRGQGWVDRFDGCSEDGEDGDETGTDGGYELATLARRIDELEALYASQSWSIRQSFPTVKRERYDYPVPSVGARRNQSLLRREVLAEDIYCEADECVDDGWGHTGSGVDDGEAAFHVDDVVDLAEEAVYWDHERWMWAKGDPPDTASDDGYREEDVTDTAPSVTYNAGEEEGWFSETRPNIRQQDISESHNDHRPSLANGMSEEPPTKQLAQRRSPVYGVAYGPAAKENCRPTSTSWHNQLVAPGPVARYHEHDD